jgi:hypothetical protein
MGSLAAGATMKDLQQFVKKESAWRFLKLALALRAPEPAFRHILITLANHANKDGICWPSYHLLMIETGYTTETTITAAIKHWKLAGVLTWEKGWGNAHSKKSNTYQFHEDAMETLVSQQKTDRGNPTDETTLRSDEIPLGPDETTLESDEIPLGGCRNHTKPGSKVSVLEQSQLQNGPVLEPGAVTPVLKEKSGRQSCSAPQAQVEETPVSGTSYETPVSGISSPAVFRTVAQIIAELPHERQMGLYRRTNGNYGPAEAQAEVDAWRAEHDAAKENLTSEQRAAIGARLHGVKTPPAVSA